MALSLDGSAASAGSNGSAASLSLSLTTTLTNDIVVLVVGFYTNNTFLGAGSTPCVSSVTGGSLNWVRRSRNYQISNLSGFPLILEVWWAYAPSALSSASITANFNQIGGTAYTGLTLFAVNGANLDEPFDMNSALPAVAEFGNGGSSSHPVTGISTNNANTFEFAVLAVSAGGTTATTADSGFTLISSKWSTSSFGGFHSEYQINSSTLSSVTQNVFSALSSISTNYIAYVDAIQAAPATRRGGPKFVSTGGGTVVNSTSVTPALPGSRSNGNLLLAWASVSSNINAVWPAGWTVIENWIIGTQNGSKAWRYVDGTETAPNITWSGGNVGAMAQVVQYSGVDPVNPIGASSHNSAGSTSVTSTAVTTTRANSLVVSYLDAGFTPPPPVPPAYTPRSSGGVASPAQGGWQISDELQATLGATSDSVAVTLYLSVPWLEFITEILSAPTGKFSSYIL